MYKKLLATSLCAATIFSTSLTATHAASNEEVKKEVKPQYIQMALGDNDLTIKLLKQLCFAKGGLNLDLLKDLVNQSIHLQNTNIVKENNNKSTYNQTKQEQATKKETTKEVSNKNNTPTTSNEQVNQNNNQNNQEVTVPSTNNNTKTPTNSNNQQVETPKTTENTTQTISNFEQQVVDLTNAERAKAGLKPLEIYTPLMKSAHAKSEDMANNHYFSHTSPTYGSPFDQMKAFGISYRSAGENIAQGQRTPQEVVQAWMNSAGHRANILNANYTHIGVGFVENGYYWTQQFIQQ